MMMKKLLRTVRKLFSKPHFLFYLAGIGSTVWFLIRVIPKPSRAAYPCMRAAAPIMSGFVVYLIGLWGSAFAVGKARKSFAMRRFYSGLMFLLILAIFLVFTTTGDVKPSLASSAVVAEPPDGPNNPMGIAQGIYPGRVTWAHDRAATDSLCENGPGDRYFRPDNYDQAIIDSMVIKSLLNLTGASGIAEAWDSIFTYHNIRKSGQRKGYTEGETIFIKVNQGTASWLYMPGTAYEAPDILSQGDWKNAYAGACEASPPVALALLRTLVNNVGIAQQQIFIGDPISHVYKHNYDVWHGEFPDVHYIDKSANFDRTVIHEGDTAAIGYSDMGSSMPDALTDKLFKEITDAAYMINIANLKPHLRAGVTLCAKNHFGSHSRSSAEHLHPSLICPTANNSPVNAGYNKYRAQVELMGSMYLGRNTMLFVVDGLWGGGPEETKAPRKWNMEPFHHDWTSSIFMSLDQVALESVCYDFIRTEYDGVNQPESHPNWDGVDDYLHQAADKVNWPDGVTYDPEQDGTEIPSLGAHEHWQNATTKAYTRNLATGDGIELVQIPPVAANLPTSLPDNIQHREFEVANYPNPFADNTEIRFYLPAASNVKISVFDMNGRLIQILVNGSEPAGKKRITWHANAVAPGFYVARFEITGQHGRLTHSLKMQVSR
jgi:hypothetical protein